MREEAALIGVAPSDGQARIMTEGRGSHRGLIGKEVDQFDRARVLGDSCNGGTLWAAKAYLEARGWTVYWDRAVGPLPPPVGGETDAAAE